MARWVYANVPAFDKMVQWSIAGFVGCQTGLPKHGPSAPAPLSLGQALQ